MHRQILEIVFNIDLMTSIVLIVDFQLELAKMLLAEGQSHLFAHWSEPGVDDEEKKSFFDQV